MQFLANALTVIYQCKLQVFDVTLRFYNDIAVCKISFIIYRAYTQLFLDQVTARLLKSE